MKNLNRPHYARRAELTQQSHEYAIACLLTLAILCGFSLAGLGFAVEVASLALILNVALLTYTVWQIWLIDNNRLP